jgi:hypothetical protein
MLFKGWRVLKFRQLRSLMLMKDLTFDTWEKELASDPLEPPRQMKLF